MGWRVEGRYHTAPVNPRYRHWAGGARANPTPQSCPPRPRRVLIGRKAYAVAGADGLNWGALANCESGGNPRAVNPAGYYGLYQFDLGTWASVGGSGDPAAAPRPCAAVLPRAARADAIPPRRSAAPRPSPNG